MQALRLRMIDSNGSAARAAEVGCIRMPRSYRKLKPDGTPDGARGISGSLSLGGGTFGSFASDEHAEELKAKTQVNTAASATRIMVIGHRPTRTVRRTFRAHPRPLALASAAVGCSDGLLDGQFEC